MALSALPVIHHGVGYSPELKQTFTQPGYATALGHFFENDPILGVISRLGLHGTVLKFAQYYVGILAATILFIATNAGMIGISRLSWSLSEHRQLPQIFSRLHPRFRTPWFTLMFFSAFACALILYGNTEVLGNLYSFGAMLSFTIAHAAIVALRVKDPDRERPYKAPWDVRIRGVEIPMTAVIGGIGTAAAWVAVTVLHGEARLVGHPLDDRRHGRLLLLPKAPGTGSPQVLQAFPARSARRTSRSSTTARRWCRSSATDVSASALKAAAKLIGEDGVVYAIFVLPVPQPALARGGAGGGGGAGPLGAGERPHPGQTPGHQDPHRPDPHPQPRLGPRRGSRTGRLGRHLLVHDPRPRGRAAASVRRPPTCSAGAPAG